MVDRNSIHDIFYSSSMKKRVDGISDIFFWKPSLTYGWHWCFFPWKCLPKTLDFVYFLHGTPRPFSNNLAWNSSVFHRGYGQKMEWPNAQSCHKIYYLFLIPYSLFSDLIIFLDDPQPFLSCVIFITYFIFSSIQYARVNIWYKKISNK